MELVIVLIRSILQSCRPRQPYFYYHLYIYNPVNQIFRFPECSFQPQIEVFANINDAYLGIDGSARRLLAYPVKGAEHFFRFDEINSWRIAPVGKHNYRLEVLTSNLDVPVFCIVLRPAQVLNTEARLKTLLGA